MRAALVFVRLYQQLRLGNQLRQYVYFCTSQPVGNTSDLVLWSTINNHLMRSTLPYIRQRVGSRVLRERAYVSIRQHTSAFVSVRQHTSAYVSIRQRTSAHFSMRQRTSAYVSIRQHA